MRYQHRSFWLSQRYIQCSSLQNDPYFLRHCNPICKSLVSLEKTMVSFIVIQKAMNPTMIPYIMGCLFVFRKTLFLMWNHSIVGNFENNSKCKCDQGKAILDGIEFLICKITCQDICIEPGLWGCGLVSTSMSLSILRCTIVGNAFSGNLDTYKSQYFPTWR